MCISTVGQRVFTSLRRLTRIKVGVAQSQLARREVLEIRPILFYSRIHAFQVQGFSLRTRHLEGQRLERSNLGDQPKQHRVDSCSESRLLILLAPFPLELRSLQ